MKTECTPKQLEFERVGKRQVVATFDAEHISSDGGPVMLHRTDRRFGLLCKFDSCFRDHRVQDRKVVYDAQQVEAFFVDAFLDAHRRRCVRWC